MLTENRYMGAEDVSPPKSSSYLRMMMMIDTLWYVSVNLGGYHKVLQHDNRRTSMPFIHRTDSLLIS